ncbi:MAG: hypothetical protein KGL39_05375 [Patescibacteria group bacterium]|nr:hypothetical protein [Patescibacteria group bacterium]
MDTKRDAETVAAIVSYFAFFIIGLALFFNGSKSFDAVMEWLVVMPVIGTMIVSFFYMLVRG